MKERKYDFSWQDRAKKCIAQGALTNSKRPESFVYGIYPTHVDRGYDCFIVDTCNNIYIDYICGLGTNLLGYNYPFVFDKMACNLSLSTTKEVLLAERLKSIFPFTTHWKILKTGTEACMSAIKIARAYTKRDLVLTDGYHGHSDDFISIYEPSIGIPKRDFIKPFNVDLIPQAAAVIIEPVITDWSEERREWLFKLQSECIKHGTLLIFDEIITGLRFPKFSVSNFFGIDPDLILLGKALGGGHPISAIGGRDEIMNCGEYFVSGTFYGETLALEASLNLLNILIRDGTKFNLKELWDKGSLFLEKFNNISPSIQIKGYPTRGVFVGDELNLALFWQECCLAGILFCPSWFFNFPLINQTDFTISICKDIIKKIDRSEVELKGEMPKKPFAQKVRDGSKT